jgi:molecular chaperone GrpE
MFDHDDLDPKPGESRPDFPEDPDAGMAPRLEASAEACDEMMPELTQLQQALTEADNRCLRVMADFENYRKRTLANQAEASQEGKKQLALELLEVVDNFQRALEHATGEDEFVTGVRAILQQLLAILGRHGLERLEVMDHPFDPNFHEVLDMVPDPILPEHTITKVYKDGFLFDGRLLRPALVQVSNCPTASGETE